MSLCPQIVVVMPCFNAAEFLGEAIESVLAQTFREFVLIIVDDGSTDDSVGIVRRYAQSDRRVQLIRQSNSGPSIARNRGAAAVASDAIAFIDSDDSWLPDHLQKHIEAFKADPNLGVSFSACAYVTHAGGETGKGSRAFKDNISKADLLSLNPTTTCSAIVVRRAAFADAGGFRTDMHFAEDQEWLFRVVAKNWYVRSNGLRSVKYRMNPNSLSADTERMKDGWRQFVSIARTLDPELVSRELPKATANMNLYWARRRYSGGQGFDVAVRYIVDGVSASPYHVLARAISCAGSKVKALLRFTKPTKYHLERTANV